MCDLLCSRFHLAVICSGSWLPGNNCICAEDAHLPLALYRCKCSEQLLSAKKDSPVVAGHALHGIPPMLMLI